MLAFLLDYMRDGVVMYSYMPDRDENRVGHVGLNLETGERIIESVAPGDRFKNCAFHMLSRIEEFAETGDFIESGLVAWA